MRAIEIVEHFLGRADWVDLADTVDRVIIGEERKNLRRVLVTWMSSLSAVRKAVEGGFDGLITHEPTFYDHEDLRHKPHVIDTLPGGSEKKRLILDSGLTIIRNHDAWDRFPQVGIPWAWARFLGLGDKPAGISPDGYQHRYDIEPTTVDAFAASLAERTAAIGEPAVQVVGDGRKSIRSVGIGTGCCCGIAEYLALGCDLSIVCDDGPAYWKSLSMARDAAHPFIRVNHATSEEPGMATMTRYINENLPGVSAQHLPHGCYFRLVGK